MEHKTLLQTVREITGDPKITANQAKAFASENFGELAAFIRADFAKNIVKEKQRLADIAARERKDKLKGMVLAGYYSSTSRRRRHKA